MISLVSLGILWLWQGGYMIYWALGALCLSVTVYGFELWMLQGDRPLHQSNEQTSVQKPDNVKAELEENSNTEHDALLDPSWTPIELKAWQQVVAIAHSVDPNALSDRRAVLDLGHRTIETVAQTLHPDEENPMLRFTVPEALALVERVAGELRPFIIDAVPLGDQITVAQAMRLYRWKSVAGLAGQAYDIWRVIRVMNPVTAATQEMREQVSKKLVGWGRDALARKFIQRYVEEVGRAAIDLYGGRLAVSSQQLERHVSAASRTDLDQTTSQIAEPLRILVAGQVGVGKSSIVNTLTSSQVAAVDVLPSGAQTTPYEMSREDFPDAILLDSKGLRDTGDDLNQLVEAATQCDMILYVIDAKRVDRHLDAQFLRAVRHRFTQMVNRRPPPVLVALTHIDRLRPFRDWSPPYDLSDTGSEKVRSILTARDALAKELGSTPRAILPLPVYFGGDREANDVDAVWAAINDMLPEARNAQLVRSLSEAGAEGFSLKKVMAQARSASRTVAKTLRS